MQSTEENASIANDVVTFEREIAAPVHTCQTFREHCNGILKDNAKFRKLTKLERLKVVLAAKESIERKMVNASDKSHKTSKIWDMFKLVEPPRIEDKVENASTAVCLPCYFSDMKVTLIRYKDWNNLHSHATKRHSKL